MIADRGSQIADRNEVCDHMETYFCDHLRSCDHDRRRSQKIEPCSISCDRLRSDHLRSIAIVRSYGNQSFAIRDRNASHNISSSLPRFNARLFDCRNGLCYECVYYCSRKDFNDKNKEASYWEKIGQKIHLSAKEAEAKFLQHKNCIRSLLASHADVLRGSSRVPAPRGAGTRDEPLRTSAWEARSLWNPKPMFSTVLELATTRPIMTNRRSKFACSKISALPRSRCCLLFSLHARVYLTFSLTKTYACGRLCDRCDYMETAFFAIVCDCLRSTIVCDRLRSYGNQPLVCVMWSNYPGAYVVGAAFLFLGSPPFL